MAVSEGSSVEMLQSPGMNPGMNQCACTTARQVTSMLGQLRQSKADSTLRASRAVPHPSTDRALCRLTSEVERDPVHSTRYGRQRRLPGESERKEWAMRLCASESHVHAEGSTREKGGRSYELHAAGSGQRCCSSIQALCLITAQRCPVWPAVFPARANSRIATRQDTAAYATAN